MENSLILGAVMSALMGLISWLVKRRIDKIESNCPLHVLKINEMGASIARLETASDSMKGEVSYIRGRVDKIFERLPIQIQKG